MMSVSEWVNQSGDNLCYFSSSRHDVDEIWLKVSSQMPNESIKPIKIRAGLGDLWGEIGVQMSTRNIISPQQIWLKSTGAYRAIFSRLDFFIFLLPSSFYVIALCVPLPSYRHCYCSDYECNTATFYEVFLGSKIRNVKVFDFLLLCVYLSTRVCVYVLTYKHIQPYLHPYYTRCATLT